MARPISDTHRRISAGFIGSYLGKRNQCLRDVVLWMLAGPDSTRSGLLRVHVGALADDLGHSKPAVIDALTRLHADGHIVWDADNRTALCWFVMRNVTLPAETNRKSYLAECNYYNDCPPRSEAIKWIQAIEITIAKGAQRGRQSSYQREHLSSAQQRTENREQNTSTDVLVGTPAVAVDPKPKRAMARPTIDEAIAYFQEQGSTTAEATAFFDRNTAGGWLVGRNPMKDWRAAARTWLHNEAKWSRQGGYRGKPQANGHLSGQGDVFSPSEMAKIRANPDTTPW